MIQVVRLYLCLYFNRTNTFSEYFRAKGSNLRYLEYNLVNFTTENYEITRGENAFLLIAVFSLTVMRGLALSVLVAITILVGFSPRNRRTCILKCSGASKEMP